MCVCKLCVMVTNQGNRCVFMNCIKTDIAILVVLRVRKKIGEFSPLYLHQPDVAKQMAGVAR